MVGFVIFDRIREVVDKQQPESQTTVSAVEGATTTLFSNEFFQFQADKTWVEIPEVSRPPNKYVYKSKNGPLVQHVLTVYVGAAPSNELLGTRVYPVEVLATGSFTNASGVSEHCRAGVASKAKNEPESIKYKNVSFLCNAGGVNYRVLVGVNGGGPTITMPRPGGKEANYTIIYDDVTAYPSDNKIDAIVGTFQTR